MEFDELYDEVFKFKTKSLNLPVQLKEPDEEVPFEQLSYIQDYINTLEKELLKIETAEYSQYDEYIDIDNFADYWMTLEVVGNYEAFKPRSVKMYKGRDGVDSPKGTVCKLKAGPLWDQELLLMEKWFFSKNAFYFSYLFKDEKFINVVKQRWPVYRDLVLGKDNKKRESLLDFTTNIYKNIKKSADRDINYWNNPYFTLDDEYAVVKEGFIPKIEWMDEQIMNFVVEK